MADSQPLFGIYGASGLGREVLPLVRAEAEARGIGPDRIMFIDDQPASDRVNGHRALRYEEFLALPAASRQVTIAIANSAVRERLAARLEGDGLGHLAVRASNAVVMDAVEIGEGAILSPFTCLTSNIRIGRFFHANLYSYVAHDCVIGDFVTFAPGVKCNGNIVIEDHAYIGTGAVLRQGRPGQPLVIGRGAVVGMGAVVTRDVPAGVTVVGNPARPLVKA